MNMNFRTAILSLFLFSFPTISMFAQKEKEKQDAAPPSSEAEFEKEYQERIKKDKIGGVYIPKNLEDACLQLTKLSAPESQGKFKKINEDSVTMYLHGSLGKWIIMNWSFFEGSRLSHYFRTAGVTYPDDMADVVIVAWHRNLNGKPMDIKQLLQFFKERRKQKIEAEQVGKLKKGQVIFQETRKKSAGN